MTKSLDPSRDLLPTRSHPSETKPPVCRVMGAQCGGSVWGTAERAAGILLPAANSRGDHLAPQRHSISAVETAARQAQTERPSGNIPSPAFGRARQTARDIPKAL